MLDWFMLAYLVKMGLFFFFFWMNVGTMFANMIEKAIFGNSQRQAACQETIQTDGEAFFFLFASFHDQLPCHFDFKLSFFSSSFDSSFYLNVKISSPTSGCSFVFRHGCKLLKKKQL